ncbi:ATP-binding protein [Actinoplanes sp. NPDC051851]|uniref:AAA family ATPase n=1 Tax=Actinoplanes sp. NPDC051851 TaxID=3154753 RepID=UPI00343A998A
MIDRETAPRPPAAEWQIYRAASEPHDGIEMLPPPPPWRRFDGGPALRFDPDAYPTPAAFAVRARSYEADEETVNLVNAAIRLRRPLLVTGKPGMGKSTLAHSIAYELRLGPVLSWPVTSRSTLGEALYRYDAIGRLGAGYEHRDGADAPPIGRYLTLGPLGTALLPWERPRVLLVDELDKSDVDLPNNLLHVFEEGQYEILELTRLPESESDVRVLSADGLQVPIHRGRVTCRAFPIVVITNNAEREFPPPFLRRCIRVDIPAPRPEALTRIVAGYFSGEHAADAADLIREFIGLREHADLATDQLLNAIYLVAGADAAPPSMRETLKTALLRELSTGM